MDCSRWPSRPPIRFRSSGRPREDVCVRPSGTRFPCLRSARKEARRLAGLSQGPTHPLSIPVCLQHWREGWPLAHRTQSHESCRVLRRPRHSPDLSYAPRYRICKGPRLDDPTVVFQHRSAQTPCYSFWRAEAALLDKPLAQEFVPHQPAASSTVAPRRSHQPASPLRPTPVRCQHRLCRLLLWIYIGMD